MPKQININAEPPPQMPGWLMGALLVATFAAECLDNLPAMLGALTPKEPAITAAECEYLCEGPPAAWTTQGCWCTPQAEQ